MRAILAVACACLAACATAPEPTRSEPVIIGESFTLDAPELGGPRQINVWLPPDYSNERERRYTVLYVLDGGLDQDFQHIAGLAQLGALSWTYETLIVVGVGSEQRRRELTAPPSNTRLAQEFPEAGEAAFFRAFLAEQVIPTIESRYRTDERRALIGESLAGLFVLDTFLTTPDLFHDYIAISPSLWWDDKALARSTATRLAQHASSDRRLYLTIADEGDAMQTGMDMIVQALSRAPPSGLQWRFVDRSASETHATIYHGAALDALRWLYAIPPEEYGPAPWYMLDEEERDAAHR